LPVGLHVKQIQQALHRPLSLLRFCGQNPLRLSR
jgi:hypothetical protein